jgi:hypothetical protein
VRRHRSDNIDDNAYDAFLDIVANLVGILVILIMVVGVRAKNAWQSQATPEPAVVVVETNEDEMAQANAEHQAAVDQLKEEINAVYQQTQLLERDAHELHSRAATIAAQTDVATARRNRLQLLASAVENEIQVQKEELESSEQSAFEGIQQIAAAENELDRLKSQIHTVSLETLAPTELTHHPTPISKTVFGREEHFRLMSNRVVRVPLNELVDALLKDARSKLWKMEESNEVTDSMAPFEGFRLKYTMGQFERLVDTPSGPQRHRSIELVRFTLYPVAEDLGEPIEDALTEGSQFDRQLADHSPEETTITVWTYPESYDKFRLLQEHLIARGYRVAARPLPAGRPISGSPGGNRSAAQ